MSPLRVFHEHQLVGEHDGRCQPIDLSVPFAQQPWHWRHEGNDLVVREDGRDTTYASGQWSACGIDLVCGFHTPDPSCPRCHPGAAGSA